MSLLSLPSRPRDPAPAASSRVQPVPGPRWVRHVAHDLPEEVRPGEVLSVHLEVENVGSEVWRAWSPGADQVGLAVRIDGVVRVNHPLPAPVVVPGERCTFVFTLESPAAPGLHELCFELVRYQVAQFHDEGAPRLTHTLRVRDVPPERGDALWSKASRVDPWHFLPTRGLRRLRDGTSLPVFVERAQGCHLFDQDGRRYVDYSMGWGSILLGHAHPEVSAALATALQSGATTTLPQPIELEVAERLVEDFPGAEMVCFGKNGSDACTFAVRMARLFTGRRTVLFAGFHGWQDFWVEHLGFDRTGVPERERPYIVRFPAHDLEAFDALFERHRADLAAILLEPAPWAGNGLGFEQPPEATTLQHLRRRAHESGALLILDEIVTGYRFPGGSVQRATGVSADLSCLGKALASGLPLSAVVGREDVFRSALPRAFYAATFHNEAYSLVAARASIDVYRREPVAQHVWSFGERLRDGVLARAARAEVPAQLFGPPFRMNLRLEQSDPRLFSLEHTLLQQELLRSGVVTCHGTLLPSYAHDDAALAHTLQAFESAFAAVAESRRAGDCERRLEIPPLLDP